ncbi:hypothetical protein FISHEDRAFT_56955 [Fistulina hepatica ATCC 64428]|nr:hypothetical protein FISHEDRAFT_56955 [Fistulina hepatica ATCC 64428]
MHGEVVASIGHAAASAASSALKFAHCYVSSRISKMLSIGSAEMTTGLAYVTERMPAPPRSTELGPYVIDLAERQRLAGEFLIWGLRLSKRRSEIRARADNVASNVLLALSDAKSFKKDARRFRKDARTSFGEAQAQRVKKDSINEILALGDSGPPPEAVSQPRGNTNPLFSVARIDDAQQSFVPAARSYHDASRVRPTERRHRETMDSLSHAFESQTSVSGNPSQTPNTRAPQESRYMYPTMSSSSSSSSTSYTAASNEQYPGSSRQPNRIRYDDFAPREQMYMASPAEDRVGPSAPETYVPPFPGNNTQPAAGGYATGYTGRYASGIGAEPVHVEYYRLLESGRNRGRTSRGTSYTTIPLPGRRQASLVRLEPVQPQAARVTDDFTTANAWRNDADYGRSVTQPYYAEAGRARERHQDVSGRERPRDAEERRDRHHIRQRDTSREPRRREDGPSGVEQDTVIMESTVVLMTAAAYHSSYHQARRDY